jgi:hypothetical protein
MLNKTPRRIAWYPGSKEKAAAFLKTFENAERLGTSCPAGNDPAFEGEYLPWCFQTGLSPDEVCPADCPLAPPPRLGPV